MAIKLYDNGAILFSKISTDIVRENKNLYMCYGHMDGAFYKRRGNIINVIENDEVIEIESNGLKYQEMIFKPDNRFKEIKRVGKYAGKCYEAEFDNKKIYLVFIDNQELYMIAGYSDTGIYSYDISKGKILINKLNIVLKEESSDYLIFDNDWVNIIFKFKENMTDYSLWEKNIL
ncbi:MAG: hypothetical protein J1E02_00290 [Coprobacter sp.]|nr:hypothetical protein [Coprobacter sp.]